MGLMPVATENPAKKILPTPPSSRPKRSEPKQSRFPISKPFLFSLPAIIVAAALPYMYAGGGPVPSNQLIFHTVARGDLPIVVTERGNIESQSDVQIICDVDDISGDGINGTPIVWIIPNGTSVKKGDLLVELDSSGHQERLDDQILDTEEAQSKQIQAKARYDNQITQNETLAANAELEVKLAELELQMFIDEKNGTHQLEVEEIERAIEDANNEILAAQANLTLKKNEKQGIEALFKLGYAGKSEVDRTRLEYLQAESQYAAKMNRLNTQLATLKKKQSYEREMRMLELKGKVETARRKLEQVKRDNEASLEQARAAMIAADEQLKKEQERLQRYRQQVANCKIYAPQDGMVAYAVPSRRAGEQIREGTPMRQRQHILSLPNLESVQVKTAIHESVLDQVQEGMPASIRVDAFPDRSYPGSVHTVAVLPDQSDWLNSNTKVYETIVTVDKKVSQLKPGLTAIVEIQVDHLYDVLKVPVQALVQVKKDTWCYVETPQGVLRRDVEVGRSNDKFVEIRSGLEQGDRIVLNPMAILDSSGGEDETPKSEPVREEPKELAKAT